MNPKTIAGAVWDGLEPEERRCLAMLIDARHGPPEYLDRLNKRYPASFQLDVLAKRQKILCETNMELR